MQIECDVLVVGAGPAGLATAVLLSKKGFTSAVIEKGKSVGLHNIKYDITEGNIISDILEKLEIKPDKISEKSEWISPNHSFILESDIKDFYFKRGSEKDSLENKLVEKIDKDITKIFLNSKINSYSLDKNGDVAKVEVISPDGKKEFLPKYIVVADGSNSELRKKLKIKTKIFATFRGLGILAESKEDDIIPYAKIYFNKDLAPGGYIYTGSVGKDVFSCVVIDDFFSDVPLKRNLDTFFTEKFGDNLLIKGYFDGIGLSGVQDIISGNVMFIGGAALFHDPFLGYGLNYAIESAVVAVRAIEKEEEEIYIEYGKNLQKKFEEMKFAREIWRKADNNFFDELIITLDGKNSYQYINAEIKTISKLLGIT